MVAPICPRCGRPLITPIGGDKPDYCYHCDREYRYLDTVKKLPKGDKHEKMQIL